MRNSKVAGRNKDSRTFKLFHESTTEELLVDVRCMRQILGSDAQIAVDALWRLEHATALTLGGELDRRRALWLEAPSRRKILLHTSNWLPKFLRPWLSEKAIVRGTRWLHSSARRNRLCAARPRAHWTDGRQADRRTGLGRSYSCRTPRQHRPRSANRGCDTFRGVPRRVAPYSSSTPPCSPLRTGICNVLGNRDPRQYAVPQGHGLGIECTGNGVAAGPP